jgi:hypothetical protein
MVEFLSNALAEKQASDKGANKSEHEENVSNKIPVTVHILLL